MSFRILIKYLNQQTMNYQYILTENDSGVSRISLNRPEVFNALNGGILKELAKAVTHAAENQEIRVIILSGTGEKAFCSGADLKAGFEDAGKPLGQTLKENYEPLIHAIRNAPKPVICRMNGIAAGAGMSLALACDMIVADENAYMTELFVGIGLMPDAGSMFFLPRLVGMQKAFDIFSTGRKIYMKEALDLGLVIKTAPTDQLDTVIHDMIAYYTQAPTKAIAEMKYILNKTYENGLQGVLDMEAAAQTKCGVSNDFGEGVMAFLQKRKPEFKGN